MYIVHEQQCYTNVGRSLPGYIMRYIRESTTWENANAGSLKVRNSIFWKETLFGKL